VQEDERLLAEHDEYRVAQLRQFAEHEEPGPEAAHAILLDVAVGEGSEYRSVIGQVICIHANVGIKFPSLISRSRWQAMNLTIYIYIYIERLERILMRREHNTNLGTQTEWKSP